MSRELIQDYSELVLRLMRDDKSKTIAECLFEASTMPAPRFYMSQAMAQRYVMRYDRGQNIGLLNPLKIAEVKELHRRYVKRKSALNAKGIPEIKCKIIEEILEEPAPSFYLDAGTLRCKFYAYNRIPKKDKERKRVCTVQDDCMDVLAEDLAEMYAACKHKDVAEFIWRIIDLPAPRFYISLEDYRKNVLPIFFGEPVNGTDLASMKYRELAQRHRAVAERIRKEGRIENLAEIYSIVVNTPAPSYYMTAGMLHSEFNRLVRKKRKK